MVRISAHKILFLYPKCLNLSATWKTNEYAFPVLFGIEWKIIYTLYNILVILWKKTVFNSLFIEFQQLFQYFHHFKLTWTKGLQ